MLVGDIKPYIRYARYLEMNKYTNFDDVIPLDARLFYVLDGYGKIKVCDTEYEMKKSSLLLINSGINYKILTPCEYVKFIVINFDYTQNASNLSKPINPVPVNQFKKELLVDFNTFVDSPLLSEILYIKHITNIEKLLSEIIRESTQKLLYYENKILHLMAECISDCLRCYEINYKDIKRDSYSEIIDYIHDNISKKHTNKSIGDIFGYHPNYISSLIKKITGMPLHQYIINVRLNNALNLLENSNMSISEIAMQCGFCDSAYFSGYFKKHFGISPSQHRSV